MNIPDVCHLVLYHLPFNEIEFNQMSGRAGRDGNPAYIHLLYGRNDARINEQILSEMTPNRDGMAEVYKFLRRLWRERGCDDVGLTESELHEVAASTLRKVPYSAVLCGLRVFNDLGLIKVQVSYTAGEPTYVIHMQDGTGKVELTNSVRYVEGLDEQEIFRIFKDWALGTDFDSLQRRVTHPITPSSADETFGKEDES